MSEKYFTEVQSVATGTDKTAINIFHSAATPTNRGCIVDLTCGGTGTPGDNNANFRYGRTTGVGTEGSGLVPNNIDSVGPAGDFDSGLGVFSGEPTYTANKSIFAFPLHHRATFRWCAQPGFELLLTATQNNGAGVKSVTSTSTQAYGHCLYFME